MRRSDSSISYLARFLWLVLTWSVLIAPRLLGAEPAPVTAEHLSPPTAFPEFRATRGPVQPVALGFEAESTVAPAPSAGLCDYWIVSSRRSAQHPREWQGCPLDVVYRAADRRPYASNMVTLAGALSPGVPVCVVVHGSFVSDYDNAVQAEEAFTSLRSAMPGLPLHVIFFTWPSDGPYTHIAPVDIAVRGVRADYNAFHLAWLLSQITDDHPICLVGHSHGCRTVMATLHLLGGGSIEDYCFTGYRSQGKRIRAVTAAAAFDHNWLNPGQRYGCAVPRAEAILNLQNRRDLPLAFYPLTRPFAHRAIARTGLTSRDRYKLGPYAARVADCDVTEFLGHEHYWPEYYSRPEIVATTLPYIYDFSAASR